MTLPNFLIIGAERCGTTSIYNYLAQHPQVFVTTQKETHFFSSEGTVPKHMGPGDHKDDNQSIIQLPDYIAQYDGATTETALVEVCPSYLNAPLAATNIQRHVPKAHLVVILRQPAARAYSAYLAHRRMGREPEADFESALALGPERRSQGWAICWDYKRAGLYVDRLAPFMKIFGRDRFSVLLYDDLARDPAGFMRSLFRLLQVDVAFRPDLSRRYNPSGIPRSTRLHRLIKSPSHIKKLYHALVPNRLHTRLAAHVEVSNLRRDDLRLEIQQRLTDQYRDSIVQLQDVIGRDLSGWLEAPFVADQTN